MTIDDAVKVLNGNSHGGSSQWFSAVLMLLGRPRGMVAVDKCTDRRLSEFEAAAVAEKYQRDAAHGAGLIPPKGD